MLFNSIAFLIFLPLVFSIYWIAQRNWKIQNLIVVIASYVFYGWWDYRFLGLLFLSTFLSFLSGLLIAKNTSDKSRKWICASNIIINLSILGYFKYFNFFVENLQQGLAVFGYQLDGITQDVILPLGISFYTFQALSYSIDVYRKQIPETKDFLAFASYISFFPQLVAGPIEQASNLLPQFQKARKFDYTQAVQGMRQILWGFFKKLIIADNCAKFANGVFENYQEANGSMLILGALFFTFQIYGDFSGYSDIALGTAKLFGINLRKNFELPYFSRDITEFWRRWHISLNKWFIQYVYIPLGGSRCSHAKTIRNILIVFLLSGLWHGANWTFVVWGLYNGVLLSILTFFRRERCPLDSYHRIPPIKVGLQMLGTFVLVVLGWIIFRASSLSEAYDYIARLLLQNPLTKPNFFAMGDIELVEIGFTLFFIAVLMLTEWIQRGKEFPLEISGIHSRIIRWGIYIALLLIFTIFAGGQETFIYFQF